MVERKVAPADAGEEEALSPMFSVLISVCESFFVVMEFMCGMIVTRDLLTTIYTLIFGGSKTEVPAPAICLIHWISTLAIVYWVLYRYASTVNTSVSALVDRIGLFRPYLSNTALIVIAFQVLAFLLMALTQTYIGRWVFSYDNYYTSDSAAAVDTSVGAGMNAEGDAADTIADTDLLSDYTVDTDDDSSVPIHPSDDDVAAIATASVYFAYKKASEMLFLAPLREEVVFRAVIYSIFHQRLQLQAKLPKSLARLYSVFGTSILFGLVHLLNIFGRKYTLIYILLQVSLGIVIGTFYCQCYALHQSVFETLALHIANNLASSFLPLDTDFTTGDPLLIIPLVQTLLVYSALIYVMHRRMCEITDDDDNDGDARAEQVAVAKKED